MMSSQKINGSPNTIARATSINMNSTTSSPNLAENEEAQSRAGGRDVSLPTSSPNLAENEEA